MTHWIVFLLAVWASVESESSEESRIINGKDATLGQFPYQVLLFIQMGQGRALCGGSLLSDEWVLTAGHCVENASSFEVTLGAVDLKDKGDDPGRMVFTSTEFIRHENYSKDTISNDVAVIRLPEKIQFTDRVQPVKLPSGHADYNRQMTVVSGWGKTRDLFGGAAPKLQYTTLKVIRNNECRLLYGSAIQPTTLCCRGDNRQSTCNGDSGGPLVLEEDKSLVGVVSFGHAIGCEKMLPVAFARVTEYVDWIREKTGMSAPEPESPQ